MTTANTPKSGSAARYIVVGALILGAFFGAYSFAQARNAVSPVAQAASTGAIPAVNGGAATDPSAAGGAGCACCGSTAPTTGGVTGDPIEGVAAAEGGAQILSVDLSKGYYEPNVLKLKAGVPAEITFGQSSGCTAQIMSKDLGFYEDLSSGPKTIKVPALDKGEYAFSCGMEMVFGKIVVE